MFIRFSLNMEIYNFLLLLLLGFLSNVAGSVKKYDVEDAGFSPSHRYYESDLSYQKGYKNKTYIPQNPIAEGKKDIEPKESRFGAISYGPSGNSYGNSNGMTYGTMKLDVGGIALGALIGLGAILIIPKIAQIFAGGHEGYARGLEEEMSTVTNLLSRIDNSLAANDIDSTSCTQRIICNVVNDAVKNTKAGEASSVDEFVLTFTKNSLFSYAIGGTAIKEAVDIGRSQDADKCASTYTKCPLNKDSVMKVVSSLMPVN
ncbi:uncharacterized protein [Euwallacea fornicatus]|uniref:uncharacterized protein isoform X1 n=1 Tax=Euwallacea fornicatus TaxID=995702 RepID=UPI00338FDCC6